MSVTVYPLNCYIPTELTDPRLRPKLDLRKEAQQHTRNQDANNFTEIKRLQTHSPPQSKVERRRLCWDLTSMLSIQDSAVSN